MGSSSLIRFSKRTASIALGMDQGESFDGERQWCNQQGIIGPLLRWCLFIGLVQGVFRPSGALSPVRMRNGYPKKNKRLCVEIEQRTHEWSHQSLRHCKCFRSSHSCCSAGDFNITQHVTIRSILTKVCFCKLPNSFASVNLSRPNWSLAMRLFKQVLGQSCGRQTPEKETRVGKRRALSR